MEIRGVTSAPYKGYYSEGTTFDEVTEGYRECMSSPDGDGLTGELSEVETQTRGPF